MKISARGRRASPPLVTARLACRRRVPKHSYYTGRHLRIFLWVPAVPVLRHNGHTIGSRPIAAGYTQRALGIPTLSLTQAPGKHGRPPASITPTRHTALHDRARLVASLLATHASQAHSAQRSNRQSHISCTQGAVPMQLPLCLVRGMRSCGHRVCVLAPHAPVPKRLHLSPGCCFA